MKVKKRNGRLENFNVDKINKCAIRACEGIDDVSASGLILDSKIKLYDKIKTAEIDAALVDCARDKIMKEPNWSFVAARILLNVVYKEVLKESIDHETFDQDYRSQFIKNIKRGVKSGYYDKRLLDFDLVGLSTYLKLERDHDFRYLGIKTLHDRYLFKLDEICIETPQFLFMRVAMGLSLNEEHKNTTAKEFYDVYSQGLALPSTPTLFNSGKVHSQTASCYLSTVDDSLDGIFDSLWQEARKSKWAGGLGMDITPLRGSGSRIEGTNGESNGILSWAKLYEATVMAVNQGGLRRGSCAAYIEPWHVDYESFLDLRKGSGDEWNRTHNLNTAAWIPDEFMRRVREEADWYMFSPSDCPDLHDLYGREFEERYRYYIKQADEGIIKFRKKPAKEIWKKHMKMVFETAHPWVTFKDPSNMRYPNNHSGVVHSSNLCTEILLQTSPSKFSEDGQKIEVGETAVCQLSSINLPNHVRDGKMDYDKLGETVHTLVRAIDNAIDINYYPTEESKAHLKHRPIGIGEMGFQDLCYELDIVYDSEEGIELARNVQENIAIFAIRSSALLAKERGTYSSYEGSLWSKGILPHHSYISSMAERGLDAVEIVVDPRWGEVLELVKKHGMRNSNVMAIAPTASISYISGCEQSIEPTFTLTVAYGNLSGSNAIINGLVYFKKDMVAEGLWSPSLVNALAQYDGDVSKIDVVPEKYKKKYATAFNRDFSMLIRANAARQMFIDQSVSFNIYYDGDSIKKIVDMYMMCWEMGLKTTYYFRSNKESVKKTVGETVTDDASSSVGAACSMEEGCESCQ